MDMQQRREKYQATLPPILHPGPGQDQLIQGLTPADHTTPLFFRNFAEEPLVRTRSAPEVDRGLGFWRLDRLFDVTLALFFIALLSPVMLVTAVLVRASGSGPIIFRHTRLGRGGRSFECLKFRTMSDSAEQMLPELLEACGSLQAEWERDHKIRSDPRITPIGHYLRRFSVDELPQLFNVLRGEMSIVGPRPIVHAEVYRYAEYFTDYCAVRPGLTGLWQVSGRNDIDYEERVQLDRQYARAKCITLDCILIFRTIPVVLFGRGC
jgi:lipopolysaccharide/colanic/teichoic acid biosynthesis glycosyltransferase